MRTFEGGPQKTHAEKDKLRAQIALKLERAWKGQERRRPLPLPPLPGGWGPASRTVEWAAVCRRLGALYVSRPQCGRRLLQCLSAIPLSL